MDGINISKVLDQLESREGSGLYGNDFLLTWDKNPAALSAVLDTAMALRSLRERNVSTRIYDSGLGVSVFRDNSTRTRFSFNKACNLLGLEVVDLDEEKSQIAHGETVRETASMVSFMTEVIGIRDDIFLGRGHTYMQEVAEAVSESYAQGVLPQRPTVVNLQSDLDHPTQTMADAMHLVQHFGGLENLRGKKLAMTWAYSPSYGKPLSVAQGVVGLFTRFGMDVSLAYPEGYNVLPEIEELASRQAAETGGSFSVCNSMDQAFKDADVVYPKSWAPFTVMQERTKLLEARDDEGLKALEKRCLENNASHIDWECNKERMALTKGGEALYMHCLPADISGVSCKQGEVTADVFEKYRIETYKEASWKPFVIAAMMLLSRVEQPAHALRHMLEQKTPRVLYS